MPYDRTVRIVRETLCSVFARVDEWFDRDEAMLAFRPVGGGWSIAQVLDHITLTNHFLMLTFQKWAKVAEHRSRRGDSIPAEESDLARLAIIGERGSFNWPRPAHMEPAGAVDLGVVRSTLHRQLGECLIALDHLGSGEGALCRIIMTVNDLGKLDLYQWLYFLAQHARRHLAQMAAIEAEFLAGRTSPIEVVLDRRKGPIMMRTPQPTRASEAESLRMQVDDEPSGP